MAATPDALSSSHFLGCNCHYPMMLLGFILITILALFVCIFVCCIDATGCSPFKNTAKSTRLQTAPVHNAAKFVERKFSMEPAIADYALLNNSLSSYSSGSFRTPTLRSEDSVVSTV